MAEKVTIIEVPNSMPGRWYFSPLHFSFMNVSTQSTLIITMGFLFVSPSSCY